MENSYSVTSSIFAQQFCLTANALYLSCRTVRRSPTFFAAGMRKISSNYTFISEGIAASIQAPYVDCIMSQGLFLLSTRYISLTFLSLYDFLIRSWCNWRRTESLVYCIELKKVIICSFIWKALIFFNSSFTDCRASFWCAAYIKRKTLSERTPFFGKVADSPSKGQALRVCGATGKQRVAGL